MKDIKCKLVLLDGCLLLYNGNNSSYTRPLANDLRGNKLATKFDQKCYHYWLKLQPVMNRVT